MIEQLRYHCYKILPLVYDDCLSYYETVCKVSNKLNEVINASNNMREEWDAFRKTYGTTLEEAVEKVFREMANTGDFDAVVKRIVGNEVVSVDTSNMVVKGANYAPWKMFEVFKSYLDNSDRFYYGTPSIIGYDYNAETGEFTPQKVYGKYSDDSYDETKWGFVCSTLVDLMLMGVPFETCRINNGKIEKKVVNGVTMPLLTGGENKPLAGLQSVDFKCKKAMEYWGFSGHGTVYSANIAKIFNDAGMLHRITTDDFSELMPGDVLFYTNYAGGQSTVPFLNINHTDVFIGWNGTKMVCLNSDTTVDTGDNADNKIGYTYWNIATANPFTSYLKYYARIPQGGNPGVVHRITGDVSTLTRQVLTETNNPTIIIPATEVLESNRAYTAVVKLKPGYTGSNLRLNIFGAYGAATDTTALSQIMIKTNHAQRCGVNEYYCVFVVPQGNPNNLNGFRVSLSADSNYSVQIEDFAVFNKIVCPGI